MMNNKKSSKYAVENQVWYDFCTMPVSKCNQKIVKCRICGHNGHKTQWLDSTKQVIDGNGESWYRVVILVAHAHFVANKDIGRHVTHPVAETAIQEKYVTKMTVLKKRKLPQHVIDMFDNLGD